MLLNYSTTFLRKKVHVIPPLHFVYPKRKVITIKSSFPMSDYLHTPLGIVVIVLSAIATLTVALRIWARKIQKLRLELNDYCIVAGLVGEPLIVEICLTPIRSSH